MPKKGPNVWVVRDGAKYSIREEGVRRRVVRGVSQRTAIRIARLIAQQNRSELVIQAASGRIRARDSHGSDPFPPKG
jgi:hypothetical protein